MSGITPFITDPNGMFAPAIACECFYLKTSERDPSVLLMLAGQEEAKGILLL